MVNADVLAAWMLELGEKVFDVASHANATAFVDIVPFDAHPSELVTCMLHCTPWYFLRRFNRWLKCSMPTYSTPKLSTRRQN